MVFRVSKDCADLGLRAGAIIFRNVHIADASPALRAEISHAAETVLHQHTDLAGVRSIPEVAAFQSILREVGANPRRDPPSVGRLLTTAIKRSHLPAINNLVDAYNLVSIRTLCSLGAHDLDTISLPVELRLLVGTETFTGLGREGAEKVAPGEFGYVDAAERVLCRLDVRQAEFSKVTVNTANVLLIVEGTISHTLEMIRRAFDEVIDLVMHHCGGKAEIVARPWE
jgi:DNA/RNA-binding domain of Phe-tRNA-synthetase-like protein